MFIDETHSKGQNQDTFLTSTSYSKVCYVVIFFKIKFFSNIYISSVGFPADIRMHVREKECLLFIYFYEHISIKKKKRERKVTLVFLSDIS